VFQWGTATAFNELSVLEFRWSVHLPVLHRNKNRWTNWMSSLYGSALLNVCNFFLSLLSGKEAVRMRKDIVTMWPLTDTASLYFQAPFFLGVREWTQMENLLSNPLLYALETQLELNRFSEKRLLIQNMTSGSLLKIWVHYGGILIILWISDELCPPRNSVGWLVRRVLSNIVTYLEAWLMITGFRMWWLVLFATLYDHNSGLEAITALLLISTLDNSPFRTH
jgi:hypothetical protein